jgi:hypothetical protein
MERQVAGEMGELWLPFIGVKGRGGGRSEELNGGQ